MGRGGGGGSQADSSALSQPLHVTVMMIICHQMGGTLQKPFLVALGP